MLHPDKALELVLADSHSPEMIEVPILQSLGMVLGEKVLAAIESPPFDKAAMDGWAVSSSDTGISFKIIETVAAGDVPNKTIHPGECARIMTGAMMPKGSDKVIRVEYTQEQNGLVTILQTEPDLNVIKKGENLRPGDCVLKPKVIKPQDIGILASLGLKKIRVVKPPLTGVITTGSELKNPGEPLNRGEIYNSNGFQLCAQTAQIQCPYKYYGIVEDEPPVLSAAVGKALEECDVLILSGGVSMGDFDYVPRILKEHKVDLLFHHLAVKPGKPTLFGRKGSRYIFGLPGNPVSTFIIFEIFVKPLLFQMMGINYEPVLSSGRLLKDIIRTNTDRLEYRPVKLTKGEIHQIPYHGSTHLNAMGEANGIIRIEQGIDYIEKGREIVVRQI
ncbi:MAG: gephyrin-like molybdotransferase Glp [Spirochaetota bacterium]